MNAPQPAVTVYGADWCLDCVRSKRFLDEHGVSYEWLDIQQQPELAEKVIELNIQGGFGPKRRIPLILIGAQILSEPSDEELGRALASGQTAESG
ncbi:glutaredoxin family protein [bacterium]|nr:glutaredoxin family protein [bacterium]